MFSKIKLYILGAGVLLALAAFAGLLWQLWAQSRELAAMAEANYQLTSENGALREANERTAKAVEELAAAKARDEARLVALNDTIVDIQRKINAQRQERATLSKSNPDVKSFLDTPVPAVLRGGQLPAASADKGSQGSTSSAK